MKHYLLRILILSAMVTSFAQEKNFNTDISRTMPLGLYNGGLANFKFTQGFSLNFGVSYSETSPLHFYEFPLLAEYRLQKWQFYSGAQLNWLLDEKQLKSGNRFGGDTFGFSMPVGARFNANENFFTELKYSRNMLPKQIEPTFNNKNIFEFGAGVKF